MSHGARPGPQHVEVRADGPGAAAVAENTGIIQTGAGSQVRVMHNAVALREPSEVPPPVAVLIGLPRPAVRNFVGRAEQLDQLDQLVPGGIGVVTHAVHGLGGVGKSELALQYAASRAGNYRVVWWVIAETAETIAAGLAELAFQLHPVAKLIATQDEAATWALAWLQAHDRWLLILDNVEDRSVAEPLLGQLRHGHVLITTRRDVGWDDIADRCLRLDVLTAAAAVDLLTRLSGLSDPATAAVLAGELGCLPLALRHAGAYIRQTRTSIDGYLRRLRQQPAAVLAEAPADKSGLAVARTWTLTMSAVAAQSPLALDVLRILACLAPDDLPRRVLQPLANGDAVDGALGLLASYHMITLTGDFVAVHRLVQMVTVAELRQSGDAEDPEPSPSDRRLVTLQQAAGLLSAAVPTGDPQTAIADWPRWMSLVPHVAALAAAAAGGELDIVELLSQTAVFDGTQGRHDRAEHLARQALATSEAWRGRDHPDVAVRLNILANTLRELGRLGEAEVLERRALEIAEVTLDPDDPAIAQRLSNLSVILQEQGRSGDAEPLERRALAITERARGAGHPETAIRLNNLATCLRDLDRVADAERLQRRALAITEAAFGPDHPSLAIRLNNLAVSLRDLERAGEAEPLQRRAVAIAEAALGPEHPTTAMMLNSLANTVRALGRPSEAEPLQRRALGITEVTLGPDHPTSSAIAASLTQTLRQLR